ncbi:MAG TPA: hypothetical protein VF503_04985 [Sphingobium sp.]|uniref:DUF3617 domain-containing protein n=1 Tax=Sphingobium sp. TaxID=1912891 RepID=UPI002ED68612
MSAFRVLPVVLAVGAAAPVMGGTPAALADLEPGQWDLRSREPGEASVRLCIHDGLSLVQIKHQGQSCRQFVVEDTADRTSITYSCPRTGHGRTSIRVETPRLVQIDSQGVVDGYPFALNLEGRRTGACAPLASKK